MKTPRPTSILCFIAIVLFATTLPATAATKTFNDTTNLVNWSAATWIGGTPVNGDDLIFSNGGSAAQNSYNDLDSLGVGNITLSGSRNMIATGNGIMVTGDITNTISNRYLHLKIALELSAGAHVVTNNSTSNVLQLGTDSVNLTGSGGIVKEDVGTLEIHGVNNTFSGGVTVNEGTLKAGTGGTSGTVFGTGTIVINGSGTLDTAQKSVEVRSLNGSGKITNASGTGTSMFTVNTTSATDHFSGIIENASGGILGLSKNGTGTLKLSGSNTYSGQTKVNAGTLLINGTHIQAAAISSQGYGNTATGHYQVASGATLGGTGYIAGNNTQINSNLMLVESGGTLAPGSGGIGTLILDGAHISGSGARVLNMDTGANFAFDLSGGGGTADELHFWNYASGDFLLNSNDINLTLSGSLTAGTYTVTLFRFFSDSGTTPVTGGITSGLDIGVLGPGITGTPFLTYNGSTIDLTYTVIPEPGTVGLLWVVGVGMALLSPRRRRVTIP